MFELLTFSSINWDFIYQRHQHVFSTLIAKGFVRQGIFVESLGIRNVELTKKDLQRMATMARRRFVPGAPASKPGSPRSGFPESAHLLTPLAVPLHGGPWTSINTWLLERQVRRAMIRANMDNPVVMVYSPHPAVLNVISRLRYKCLIYECVDHMAGFPNVHPSILETEQRLLQLADMVFATAEPLAAHARKWNNSVHLIPNAVSAAQFLSARRPSKPRSAPFTVGYVGMIGSWFDVELIRELATELPAVHIRLVGPSNVSLQELAPFPNIEITGPVPYADVPSVMSGFDIGLIPFRVNPLTLATNPVKLFEYFSLGLPVVSTALPEVERFQPLADVGRNHAEFIDLVRRRLDHDDPAKADLRLQAAKQNSWEDRVAQMARAIEDHCRHEASQT